MAAKEAAPQSQMNSLEKCSGSSLDRMMTEPLLQEDASCDCNRLLHSDAT
jgi:hypothetical protein